MEKSCRSRDLADPTRGVIWIGISVILLCYPATDAPLRCWGVALQQDGQAPPLLAVGANDHHVRVGAAWGDAQGTATQLSAYESQITNATYGLFSKKCKDLKPIVKQPGKKEHSYHEYTLLAFISYSFTY